MKDFISPDLNLAKPSHACLILFFIGLAAFANAVFHPFVHDDLIFIFKYADKAKIQELSLSYEDTLPHDIINFYFRPFLEFTYRIEYALFKTKAYLYHLVNIFLHISISFLLYLLFSYLFKKDEPKDRHFRNYPFLISLIFLIHPVQVEAVSCISGISNLMFAFFVLLSFLFYLKAGEKEGGVSSKRYYLLSFSTFFLGLLSKEQALLLVVLIVFYEWIWSSHKKASLPVASPSSEYIGADGTAQGSAGSLQNKLGFKKLLTASVQMLASLDKKWLPLSGYGAAIIIYFFIRHMAGGRPPADLFGDRGELMLRLSAIPETLLMYVRMIVFPNDIHYYRSIDILNLSKSAGYLFAGFLLILAVITFVLERKHRRLFLFGWGWFILWLLPVLNIIPLIHEYSFVAAFDHFLYLPLAGVVLSLCIMCDVLLQRLGLETRQIMIVTFLGLAIGLCLVVTMHANTFWQGEVPLFERAVQYEPKLARVRFLLGRAYYFKGDIHASILELTKSAEILKSYIDKVSYPASKRFYQGILKEVQFVLARGYEAKEDFRKANLIYQEALHYDPQDVALLANIGANYMRINEFSKAEETLKTALTWDADNVMLLNSLAVCYIDSGQRKKAEEILIQALRIDPNYALAKNNLMRLKAGQ